MVLNRYFKTLTYPKAIYSLQNWGYKNNAGSRFPLEVYSQKIADKSRNDSYFSLLGHMGIKKEKTHSLLSKIIYIILVISELSSTENLSLN